MAFPGAAKAIRIAAAHSRRLEEDLKGATQEDRLRKAELGSYEELSSGYQAVRQMRVIPFDARSIAELVRRQPLPLPLCCWLQSSPKN